MNKRPVVEEAKIACCKEGAVGMDKVEQFHKYLVSYGKTLYDTPFSYCPWCGHKRKINA